MNESTNKYVVPLSIVVAGALIAGAIYFSRSGGEAPKPAVAQAAEIAVRPLSSDDHVLGNPEAPAVLIEYSDTDCPFCLMFHQTMKSLMGTYGVQGKLAWAYRHFPIDNSHPKARGESEALECAAALGGNQKFWDFADALYAESKTQRYKAEHPELSVIAKNLGLPAAEFDACVSEGRFAERVKADEKNAQESGGNGTPHSVIVLKEKLSDGGRAYIDGVNSKYRTQGLASDILEVSKDGKKIRIGGALPLELMNELIGQITK